MKRSLLAVLLVVSIMAFSIVPGMDKRFYGGEVGAWTFLGAFSFWVEGYYEEGMGIYDSGDWHVDLFTGPDVYYSMGGLEGFSAQSLSVRWNARIVLYSDSFKFEVMDYKIYPALTMRAYMYWDTWGASYKQFSIGFGSFGIGVGYPYIMVFLAKPETGKASTSWYFWPFPLTIGFDTVEF